MTFVGLSQRSRRILGTVLGFVALAALVVPSAQASGPAFKPAMLDLTGWTRLGSSTPVLSSVKLASAPLPAAADYVGPGSFLVIYRDGNVYGCTANFVWTASNHPSTKYLGAAGHCFLDDDQVNDPDPDQRVEVCVSECILGGALGLNLRAAELSFGGEFVELGPVLYARQSSDDKKTDIGRDFGLVEIPEGLTVRTSVPVWGGPTGTESVQLGKPVCLYGNAVGFGEVALTKARIGLGDGEDDGGAWYALIPSAPGDSGAAVVNCNGFSGEGAVGILTHLAGPEIAGTTIAQAMDMFEADTDGALTLQLS